MVFVADPETETGETKGSLGIVPDVDDNLGPGDGVVVVLAVVGTVAAVDNAEWLGCKAVGGFGTDAHPEAGLHDEAGLPLFALESDGGFSGSEGAAGD